MGGFDEGGVLIVGTSGRGLQCSPMSERRIVISGFGAVTGFGCGAEALWEGLGRGRSRLGPITRFNPAGMRARIAAEVADFSARDHVPRFYRKAVKVMARDTELAVAAARLAVEAAGVRTKGTLAEPDEGGGGEGVVAATYAAARMGCQIGAGLLAAEVPELSMALATSTDEEGRFSYEKWGAGGMENLTPLWLLKYLPNMLSCHVTIIHGACGPSNTITCGEASGLLSIGETMRVIQRGDADVCFSGGAESKVNPMGVARLEFAGRLGWYEGGADEAWRQVRPFDPEARGGVVGEGAGILLVEALETLEARGGRAVAEVLGFGAGHSPRSESARERSEGLTAAIENALEDAGTKAGEIDVVVPQGWGAVDADEEEAEALRRVFGSRVGEIELVTLGPMIGNAMAGQGGLAAGVGALCLSRQALPARLHAGRPAQDMKAGACEARGAKLRRALVCTPSIGGQNAALVLGAV